MYIVALVFGDVFPLGYTIDDEAASTPAREDGSEQQDVIDETRMEGSTIQITDDTTDENPKTEKNDPMKRILNMLSGMDKKMSGINKKMSGMEKKMSGMDKKISGMDKKMSRWMDKKMSEMNERWEDRFEKLETKWDRKVEDLKQATTNLEIETKNLAVRMVKDEEKIEKVEEVVVRHTRDLVMQAGEILRVENKMTDHIERLETKVDKKLEVEVNKVVKQVNEYSIRVENIEDGVNHRLEDLASRLNVSMEQSILPSYNNPIFKESLPKFYGNNVVNAMTYLSNIKKVLANVNSEHRKFELLRASLKESALNWWDMISEDVATFEEFEREFTNQYWGQTQQMRARQDLMFGSYRVGGYESRENYIIKKYSIIRHLTPKMVEEDIVTQLARHFDKEKLDDVDIRENRNSTSRNFGSYQRYDNGQYSSHKERNDNANERMRNYQHQNNASNNGQNFNQQRWRNPEDGEIQSIGESKGKDDQFEEEVRRVREEVRNDKSTGTIPKDKRQISNLEMEKKKRENEKEKPLEKGDKNAMNDEAAAQFFPMDQTKWRIK
ncbi:hypothetical protein QE152_g6620 [Popillia japonica]|uniref:Uncharacterized protein n=1 Tax=Popillia japonica TaxID=7064 RepID=A0AAW1MHC8_POPJA